MKSTMKKTQKSLTTALIAGLILSMGLTAMADRPKKKDEPQSFKVLDSTEAQWGRRSINDSVYRNYTVNAVYFERGRQALPESFHMYKPSKIGLDNIKNSKPDEQPPTVIKVNGQEQKLPSSDK